MSRGCEQLKLSSCASLENADYCLCDSDLCNGAPISRTRSTPEVEKEEGYGLEADDEDYLLHEGSGHGSSDYLDKSLDEEPLSSSTVIANVTAAVPTETTSSKPGAVEKEEEAVTDRGLPKDTIYLPASSVILVMQPGLLILSLCFRYLL